ncbi:ATP-binding cassette domain-containing protein [Dactylosporangium roseum]|uniref:ATP-binding cassette domain-containing protein n=1 Tax=Dactylosporangium roseum TaxID=47989 RepID=A0ABY5ZE62_9ACTN|nr:oligopeptide/dipeptide ABC transporter ATP-binding protein [Dactylosporangium roseum]UWZ39238.1 ATP-binding cassette domain-containing protein [Dactylosporangium roseum]
MTTPLLRLDNISKTFERRSIWSASRTPAYAVRNVSLDLHEGQTIALVGESGSGKSTLGRLAMNLMNPSEGAVRFRGRAVSELSASGLAVFRRTMQIVFQDPSAAFNPRRTVYATLAQPLQLHTDASDATISKRVDELLDTVGLNPPAAFRDALPHQLSGGQRQRVMIARALSVNPTFVVADEPLSALDVTVQAQILDLLLLLQRERGIGYLLITHDLALVGEVADQVAVMYRGRVVEYGPAAKVCAAPGHPYTRLLMASTLSADPANRRIIGGGPVHLPIRPPDTAGSGCSFAARCPLAEEHCAVEVPVLRSSGDPETQVACHVTNRGAQHVAPSGPRVERHQIGQ